MDAFTPEELTIGTVKRCEFVVKRIFSVFLERFQLQLLMINGSITFTKYCNFEFLCVLDILCMNCICRFYKIYCVKRNKQNVNCISVGIFKIKSGCYIDNNYHLYMCFLHSAYYTHYSYYLTSNHRIMHITLFPMMPMSRQYITTP
jgi:hypothetical protein